MKLTTLTNKLNRLPRPAARLWIRAHGTRLGSGSQRTAYRIGNYVVKANTCAWELNEMPAAIRERCKRVPRAALHAAGLKAPATWYAGKRREWVVQRYYRRSLECYYEQFDDNCYDPQVEWQVAPGLVIHLDVAERNVGVRKDGELVAFDW